VTSTAVDNRHLRHVALSAFDVQMIGLLARSGGEQPWYPERNAADKRELVIQMMNSLAQRGLILIMKGAGLVIVTSVMTTDHGLFVLRLTDEGRAVATQLEAMQIAPKIEVVQG